MKKKPFRAAFLFACLISFIFKICLYLFLLKSNYRLYHSFELIFDDFGSFSQATAAAHTYTNTPNKHTILTTV